MSTTKPPAKRLPAHGTRARYRIEIKPGADGVKGTPCDRCKAANSKAVADARARRLADRRRADIHLVAPIADGIAAETDSETPADVTATSDGRPEPGPMEQAIIADIADIPEDMRVPMHRSLAVLATETARDYDEATTPASRVAASRQLKDLIASLRTKREGDGNSALDLFFEEFGSGPPGVSGRPA